MESLGLNTDVSAGGRKFHVQSNYSKEDKKLYAKVFLDGEIVETKELIHDDDISFSDIEERLKDLHQELITEMEILYYISEKVKGVKHPISANKLGLLFLQKKLYTEAIEHFKLALKTDPDFAEIYTNLGKTFLAHEKFDEAIDILKEGENKASDFADLQNYLGLAYVYQKKFDDAINHLHQAIDLNPDYIGVYYHLGIAYLAKDLSEHEDDTIRNTGNKALEFFKLASEKMANHNIPGYEKIMNHIEENRYREAVEMFFETSPRDVLDHFANIENEFYLKFMYGGKGKDDLFIADYIQKLKDMIKEHPDYADYRNNLGVAYLIQCRNLFLKALDEFRTALKINSEFKKAEKNLKLAENDGKGFLILLRAILK